MRASPDYAAWVERARAIPIEDDVRRRRITLKKASKNWLCGPCPKCGGDDRFTVQTAKQKWFCRGCQKGGDIIALIDEGFSNKEIARQLKLSTATVKNHVHNILEKLQVQRRGAAAAVLREAAALRATLRHLPMILPTGLVGDILGFLV